MITASEALERLRDGNRRFVAGRIGAGIRDSLARRQEVAVSQSPFAVILGCADSRVPAEIVFDQGIGDLFIVRVAGNIATPSQVGSVEFAAASFGTRLVVVLGHSRCGAVAVAAKEIENPSEELSPGLCSIVDRVRPSVEAFLDSEDRGDQAALVAKAVRENVRISVEQLRSRSPILTPLIESDGLRVIGAEYSLDTGEVEFFDD